MDSAWASEEGRERQLEAIFRTHFADLYRYIYRQVHHALMAEDLTSAVFLKALRWLQEDRRPGSVKGWLYTTARSVIADYWREQGNSPCCRSLPQKSYKDSPRCATCSRKRSTSVFNGCWTASPSVSA